MSPLDLDYPDMEEDTLDDPKHVLKFEEMLTRYNDGLEPINSWRAQDVATAFQCLALELIARGMDVPEPVESDDGI